MEKKIAKAYEHGLECNVPGIRMVDAKGIKEIEPNADGDTAIYVPTAGILCPYSYTIALAENAAQNGVRYHFDEEVRSIERISGGGYRIITGKSQWTARWVINCAGLFA